MKMRKKVKRKKRTVVLSFGRREKIIAFFAASAMFVLTVCYFFLVFGSYDGLGLPRELSENDYNMDALYEENGLLRYEDEQYIGRAGVDVSYYQEEIDWEQAAESGVDFAMIRLGYRGYDNGELAMDPMYKENLRGAKKAGLDVGVYFFSQAINAEEAVEEAKFVIRHIRGKGIDMPVVFDMEPIHGADRIDDLTVMEKTEIADAFCQIIEKNGYEPMIYGNPYWLSTHVDMSYLTRYDTWIAHYTDRTDYPYSFKMWQYTDSGSACGIPGGVDLNLYFEEK